MTFGWTIATKNYFSTIQLQYSILNNISDPTRVLFRLYTPQRGPYKSRRALQYFPREAWTYYCFCPSPVSVVLNTIRWRHCCDTYPSPNPSAFYLRDGAAVFRRPTLYTDYYYSNCTLLLCILHTCIFISSNFSSTALRATAALIDERKNVAGSEHTGSVNYSYPKSPTGESHRTTDNRLLDRTE